ncbi:MAG: hypothetical protein KJN63_04720 [Acidimicrobiia bacterium]|nr:hypothetical protein [Acidimicrobiia bacterium]
MNWFVRFWWVVVVIVLVIAGPAAADPAGPTEYLTTIDRVEPPTASLEVRMIGGDSFFEVTQLQPVLIEVVGYEGEPYLRIRADGVVEQNTLSATTYLNEERYGAGDIVPDFVDNDAPPDWDVVGTEGRFAWHDHRSHWMNPQRPPGAQPGDTILEAVIPLVVDGSDVRVTVSSKLVAPPSWLPSIAGGLLGLLGLVLIVRWPVSSAAPAALVLMAGLTGVFSVPPETGPPITLWLPPALALGAVIAAALATWRSMNPLVEIGLALVAGVQLMVWGVLSISALWNPILPTQLWWSAQRLIVVLSLVFGIGMVAAAGARLWSLLGTGPAAGPTSAAGLV